MYVETRAHMNACMRACVNKELIIIAPKTMACFIRLNLGH